MTDNIKVIKLSNGDDIVCELITGKLQLPDKSPLIRLDRPLQIKYIPSMTSLGFKDYVAMIKKKSETADVSNFTADSILSYILLSGCNDQGILEEVLKISRNPDFEQICKMRAELEEMYS